MPQSPSALPELRLPDQAGAALLGSLALAVVALGTGYRLFAVGLVLAGAGSRLVMTTCAVAVVEALPEDHTGIASALNDTAQELGNAVGVAAIGTVTAAVMGRALPHSAWAAGVTEQFLHSQRIGFAILAAVVAAITVIGGRALTDSTSTEEH